MHLIFLIGFRNKAAVLLQWTYSYFTYKRGARIITQSQWISETRLSGPQQPGTPEVTATTG